MVVRRGEWVGALFDGLFSESIAQKALHVLHRLKDLLEKNDPEFLGLQLVARSLKSGNSGI